MKQERRTFRREFKVAQQLVIKKEEFYFNPGLKYLIILILRQFDLQDTPNP